MAKYWKSIEAKKSSLIPGNCEQEEEGAHKQQTAINWATAA